MNAAANAAALADSLAFACWDLTAASIAVTSWALSALVTSDSWLWYWINSDVLRFTSSVMAAFSFLVVTRLSSSQAMV
ncbi:hypothetical protein B0T14DRAFT_525051 [Immersiella caudata]|uniref:Uncharacterized protein n=1 Tax=Immersiella caudata TaxID=314043 RepID=A0AA40BXL5_9PEZI|nr:hypothetical protein B0T14DRAFT_525051 [Immersiella caudata]